MLAQEIIATLGMQKGGIISHASAARTVAAFQHRCNDRQMVTTMREPDHVYLLTDAEDKKRVREILTERGLTSYMNDTKWRELCRGMYQLPFPPAYQVKYVQEAPETYELEYAPAYFGDWARTHEASLGLDVEWVKIAPRFSRHRGLLVSPVIEDCSSELISLLTRIHVPFIEQGGFVVIYGHGSASTPI